MDFGNKVKFKFGVLEFQVLFIEHGMHYSHKKDAKNVKLTYFVTMSKMCSADHSVPGCSSTNLEHL